MIELLQVIQKVSYVAAGFVFGNAQLTYLGPALFQKPACFPNQPFCPIVLPACHKTSAFRVVYAAAAICTPAYSESPGQIGLQPQNIH
jgi:hypothetical protein